MKGTITRTIIISGFLLFITIGQGVAQGMPVYDNTNFVSLTKQLLESAKQTAELLKMVEQLEKAREKLEKVNNAVRQYRAARDITRNNEELLRLVRDDFRTLLNSPYIRGDEVGQVSRGFNVILEASESNLEFMGQVLTSDFLNMDDGQRLQLLERQKEASQRMLADLNRKKQRYAMIISFRRMQDLINHRSTNY